MTKIVKNKSEEKAKYQFVEYVPNVKAYVVNHNGEEFDPRGDEMLKKRGR